MISRRGVPRGARAIGWGFVGVGAVCLGVALAGSAGWAEVAPGLAVAAGLGGGLLVEALHLLIRAGRSAREATPAESFRTPDGLVEMLPLAGSIGARLDDETPWCRFARFDPPAPGRRLGPGRRGRGGAGLRLRGQVALISIFVGLDGGRWTRREIRAAHESLRSAARWVEREAASWEAPVNVGLAATYFEATDDQPDPVELEFVGEGDGFGPMEADAAPKAVALASRVAATLGFADVADLVGQVHARVDADACIWLLHLRRRGRSHAIPAGDGLLDGVGLAVCYAREASFPEPLTGPGRVDPTTVAHELLHLGGASDKYGVPLASFPAGTVPRRDVMRLDEDRLDRLRIGRLTARELGWAAP